MSQYNRSRVVADDEDVAFHVWGPPGATFAVDNATGDITAVGGTGFTIDVSATAYNTMGEVIDYINSFASEGWKAVLIDSKRSDSSNDTLLTLTTTAIPAMGLGIHKDTSVALNLGVGITMQGKGQNDLSVANIINQIVSKNTYGSGTSIIYVYELKDHDPTAEERIIGQWAGGSTTAEQTLPTYGMFENLMAQGARILVQMVGSAACTGRLGAMGISRPLASVLK